MAHIFISYARSDEDLAKEIGDLLKEAATKSGETMSYLLTSLMPKLSKSG